jgi:hypothetical protein
MTRYTPLWEQAGSYAASVDRRLIAAVWPIGACTGCAVSAPGGVMSVNVAPGAVAVPSQNATGSTLCVSDAVETVPLNPGASQPRIDLIVCQPRANDLDGGTNNDFIFGVVAGTPAASPSPPAVPAGQVQLAQINVAASAVQVTQANVVDSRPPRLNAMAEPALGAAAPLASFTTLDGETWVAKGGVNSGVWKKAREALYSKTYWSAGGAATNGAIIPYTTVAFDPYGMLSGNGVRPPLTGYYRVTFALAGAMTANQNMVLAVRLAGANGVQTAQVAGVAGNYLPAATDLMSVPAGSLIDVIYQGTNSVSCFGGANNSYLIVQFEHP